MTVLAPSKVSGSNSNCPLERWLGVDLRMDTNEASFGLRNQKFVNHARLNSERLK
jgi:hypothetical protein